MKKLLSILLTMMILPMIHGACSSQKMGAKKQGDTMKRESGESRIEGASGMADMEMTSKSPEKRDRAAGKMKKNGGKGDAEGKGVTTWKRSEVVPNTSRLMIGDREEIPLKAMQARILINGFRARVIIDCYFFNKLDRRFEGTFKLRLPDDASPYFFAFGETSYAAGDVPPGQMFYSLEQSQDMGQEPSEIMKARQEKWTGPKEARMVPKEKAAFAYHETVRGQTDPALMEWSGAGIFSARVFPIMPGKMHRIVIGYDVNLLPAGDDLEYSFELPKVAESVIDIEMEYFTRDGQFTITPLTESRQTSRSKIYRYKNPQDRTITVRIKKPGSIMLTGGGSASGNYFAMHTRPAIPKVTAGSDETRAVFLVDVSLSSNPDRFNIWLKLLEAILVNNRNTIKEFAVLFFNIEQFWWKDSFTANTPEKTRELMAYAGTLSLEGATDIKPALEAAVTPPWIKPDMPKGWNLFLLSDGSATWGETNQHSLSQAMKKNLKGSLFSYRTGLSGTDTGILNHLARESGGSVFSIVGEEEIPGASTAHGLSSWNLVSVSSRGCSDIIIAGRPVSIFPGQNLFIAGRIDQGPGTPEPILLTIRNNQGKEMKVPLQADHRIASRLTSRTYGQIAVDQLEEFDNASENYSKAYATHFRVTGKTCSLVMLESEQDYLRYNIKPEEDALVVSKNRAAEIIENIMQKIGDTLGDPKAWFLSWLEKMKSVQGISFEVSQAFLDVIKDMPRTSFSVTPQPLKTEIRTWDRVPSDFQVHLKNKKVEYDIFTAESLRRLKSSGSNDALKALSSLAENNPGDGVLIRDIGYSAMEWGLGAHAYHLFRNVAESRPFEPQTYHALALLLADMGNIDLAIAYFEVGLAGKWNARFGEFRKILIIDYLNLLNKVKKGIFKTSAGSFALARLKTLSEEIPYSKMDLMITIMWNTDSTDVDLHVIEPTGEECFYGHRTTRINGMMTQDVTQGYGPEMYMLKDAVGGSYKIRAKYFASNRNLASARTKVYATIYENWGTSQEKVTRKVVTLEYGKEMHDIATVTIYNRDY